MLLRINLLPLLARFSLICRMWVFQLSMLSVFGAGKLGFRFGLTPGAWVSHWACLLFGPGKWAYVPIFQSLSFYIAHQLCMMNIYFVFGVYYYFTINILLKVTFWYTIKTIFFHIKEFVTIKIMNSMDNKWVGNICQISKDCAINLEI